jgi:hypothetical protein
LPSTASHLSFTAFLPKNNFIFAPLGEVGFALGDSGSFPLFHSFIPFYWLKTNG